MKSIQQRVINAFNTEQQIIIQGLRNHLMAIEKGAPWSDQILEECLRMAHTLKGAARVIDFGLVVEVAHRCETIFSQARGQKLTLEIPKVRLVLRVVDQLEDLISNFLAHPEVTDEMKGASQNALANLDQILSGHPIVIHENPTPKKPVGDHSVASEWIRMNVRELDKLAGITDEIAVLGSSFEIESGFLGELLDIQSAVDQFGIPEHIQFPLKGLLKKLRTVEAANRRFLNTSRRLNSQLRNQIQQICLVPAEALFEGLPKMARDLAASENKRVDIRTQGLDCEVDRGVLAPLRGPMIHLLNNCISHGIEMPEERSAKKKDPVGRIEIELSVEGSHLRVQVTDDGRGLDYSAIRAKAIEKNLDSAEGIEKATQEELAQMVFRPGFSTSTVLTEVSGRGMGLSAVLETVRHLRGRVHLDVTYRSGCRFVIYVPTRITTDRLLIASFGENQVAIPISAIEKLERVRSEGLTQIEGHSHLKDRTSQEMVPVHSLSSLIHGSDDAVTTKDSFINIIILKGEGRKIGVAVTEFLDEREFVVKPLELKRSSFWLGAVLLSDGKAVPVLDPSPLLKKSGIPALRISEEKQVTRSSNSKRESAHILVVDDSITTRSLEKGILEGRGFRVELAVDGQEALRKLRLGRFDLVITDIEMPIMDGLTLLSEIKKDKSLNKIPVVLVTSMDNDQYRSKGMELGADHYIFKQKFDQMGLLDVITNLL